MRGFLLLLGLDGGLVWGLMDVLGNLAVMLERLVSPVSDCLHLILELLDLLSFSFLNFSSLSCIDLSEETDCA